MSYIYLDHAATTPLHPEVLEAMLPYLTTHYGNPSSLHRLGRTTRAAISLARDRIAECLNCSSSELIFTGSGTESDNAALFGAVGVSRSDHPFANTGPISSGHIITSQVEHHAVLHACAKLEKEGFRITYLPVDATGRVRVEDVASAICPDTFLASIMMVNNEVGTVQPIEEIGRMLQQKKIAFHVDAVQALGSMDIRLRETPVDMMSFSAHKINGPKGVGALYISQRMQRWLPLIYGGSQERKRRAGTENVAGIAGFARAVEIAEQSLPEKQHFMESLRQIMVAVYTDELGADGFVVNGHPTQRLPHILNVSFPGTDTETLLMNADLEGIAVSSGSACTSGSHEPSHVLEAMGLSETLKRSAIRFSFGMGTTADEITEAARKIATIVRRIRSNS